MICRARTRQRFQHTGVRVGLRHLTLTSPNNIVQVVSSLQSGSVLCSNLPVKCHILQFVRPELKRTENVSDYFTTEDYRYSLGGDVRQEYRAAQVCPNKRPDRRQEHPQARQLHLSVFSQQV